MFLPLPVLAGRVVFLRSRRSRVVAVWQPYTYVVDDMEYPCASTHEGVGS